MLDPVAPPGQPQEVTSFGALLRVSVSLYLRHAGLLFPILLVRLVPFYVFLWYLPVPDTGMHAIAETLVTVPCIAALVRFVWETATTDANPTARDALLGASPTITLKLLGTNLFIVLVVIVLSLLDPTVFFALLLVWSLVNLVTDQVVVIEGLALFKAIARSLGLVRRVWPESVGLLLVLMVPDLANIVVYSAMEQTVWRELTTRGITFATMPFSAIALTHFYRQVTPQPT